MVIPSLSGTTSESVEALEYCRARGATVLTLTGHADTPLAQEADHSFVNFAEDDTSCESFYLQSLLLALSVMHHRGEYDGYAADRRRARGACPRLLLEVKRAFEPRAAELAERLKDEPYHIITGAGSTWPQAFYYGMCILEEMQWIRTRPVHASDFFHGTLELVEQGVSVLLLKGEDATPSSGGAGGEVRAQLHRQGVVLDAADHSLPGISDQRALVLSPVLLATVLERVSAHLEVLRDHPLTTRRYYKRVAY